MRILIVEDEVRLARTLKDLLEQHNHIADMSFDGESGLDNALSGIYDAVILDVMLPKLDGFGVIKGMREAGLQTPVLMLTARSELENKVKGLDLGADYYLTKPFEAAEFLACLRAILRRRGEIQPDELKFADLTLNINSAELSCEGRRVRLRAKELELLRILMENGNKFVPKETLQLKVWGYDSEAEGNVVEVYMSFLRRKLSHIKSKVKITSSRMIGYRLEADND
ncbi:MAG: response regulator transcription factor [Clostridiales bacterium]|jgi:DNA-binding response OmpR family regulator|nr:response regulator transcription factor [Clostridiales bacterium]HOA34043.1 response regulator transcription factor [Clostridiales bacterium]HOJ35570.1 response regulator transcription factor [Clostridiales bacterium]HOL79443.1 response regulator transcription factor [Clostridiales bacterium]HPP68099.1 response regulator transcription factor [Clostridiales bacterium]